MEAKLRVIIDDRIEKLVLPSGIPHSVEELQAVVKETFGISDDFSLQYLDSEFEDYFTLNKSDQIKHKDTIKVVRTAPILLNLYPVDERFGSTSGQPSTDCETASCEESTASYAEPSGESTSSHDTIILSRRSSTERCQPWPKQFPIPQFAYETEMYLERALEDYKKNGTLLTTSKVKTDILEKLAETIYSYTAYPSSAQISDVAEALVQKYPCLKEPGSFSGYYGWQQSIKYKMANYRTKLRGFGVPEVICNAVKHKRPADQKSAKNVKKPRKAEVNYLPPYPAGEDEECQENERIELLTELKKRENDTLIKEKMAKTFAHRRHEIINQTPSIEDIKARWPALFKASHLQDEFHRITTVHLEPKFMSKLDEYTPKLLALFHSKGGALGLRLKAILHKAPSHPCINMTREVVILCLMVYLGESTDQLLKEYEDADGDSVSQDLAVQKMKIYKIKTETSKGTADFGFVVEGVKVLTDLGNFARACSMLVGFAYAVDLAYPKELRYTFEVFQKLLLELDCLKLSPKVNSLKNKLLA
ncbi:sterile alpha motif domain-containing protein 3-like isoform X2 [Brachyhypopomus gauderio]